MTVSSPEDAPPVASVEPFAKIVIGVIIGVCGSISLASFGIIVYYRDHRVMTMAQGGLLGALTVSCLAVILMSFLVLPTRTAFCRCSGLVLIPISTSISIMTGRLFRVYSTVGRAHRLGKSAISSQIGVRPAGSLILRQSRWAENVVMATLGWIAFSPVLGGSGSGTKRRSSSLRRTTTRGDSIRLIFVLSLPQLVLQLFRVSYYETGLIVEYDEYYQVGRKYCDNGDYTWVRYTGLSLIMAQFLLCLFIAWCSRDLPAVFNETAQIFKAAFVGGLICIPSILLQIFFEFPSTSPNISVRVCEVRVRSGLVELQPNMQSSRL